MHELDLMWWLLPAFFAVAVLYASVGHGGASGYLAVMAWCLLPPEVMKPTALSLNVAVSLLAWLAFARAGYFHWRLLLPFLLTSLPMAWLGGHMPVDGAIFRVLVGLALVFAAWRLIVPQSLRGSQEPASFPSWGVALLVGAVLGWVSGLIGVGGGIFLTPLLILMGWAQAKEAAAVSAPFILFNSLAGLVGWMGSPSATEYPLDLVMWGLPMVVGGGWLGAWLGSSRWPVQRLRPALALVLLVAAVKSFGALR